MISLPLHDQFASSQFNDLQYQSQSNLNLYDSPALDRLATQAAAGRYLRVVPLAQAAAETALKVCLCEDDYPGWLAWQDFSLLQMATSPYRVIALSPAEIQARLPQVIAFAHSAMAQPNYYLWGGTVGPNYDCSGLVQHAFSSQGIWLPRDSYLQEAFTQPIVSSGQQAEDLVANLEPGDLIFFGSPQKTTHVGIHLEKGYYIHSSGQEQGRNGIGIDQLSLQGGPVSQVYYQQLRGAGRVLASYQPQTPCKTDSESSS